MYQRVITPSAKRSIKKLPFHVREEIVRETKVLETNPLVGEKLSGSLHFMYSFHLKSNNVHYRVAYTVNHDKRHIEIHFVDTRENFYQKLRRLFR